MVGESRRAYETLEPKFSPGFRYTMFIILVHKYLYHQLERPIITDAEYDFLKSNWLRQADELNIDMTTYPYLIEFPFAHPLAVKAAIWGKSLWGIE